MNANVNDARHQVHKAIRHGQLPRLDGSIRCSDCEKPATEYDHRDYLQPLLVEPVCRGCNRKRGAGANGFSPPSRTRIIRVHADTDAEIEHLAEKYRRSKQEMYDLVYTAATQYWAEVKPLDSLPD